MRFTSRDVERDFEVTLTGLVGSPSCRTPCALPTESGEAELSIRDLRDGRTVSQRLNLANDLHARLSRRDPIPWIVGGSVLAAAGVAAITVGAALEISNARAGGQDRRATIALVVPGSVAVVGGVLLALAPLTFLSTVRIEQERVPEARVLGLSVAPRVEGGVQFDVGGRF